MSEIVRVRKVKSVEEKSSISKAWDDAINALEDVDTNYFTVSEKAKFNTIQKKITNLFNEIHMRMNRDIEKKFISETEKEYKKELLSKVKKMSADELKKLLEGE